MFFQFWNEISRFHCKMYVFPSFEMKFQDSKPEIEAPESKTYILHCKMYVFGKSAVGRQDFDAFFANFWRFQGKHTFYSVKCMFLLFQMCVKKSMSFWRCFWGLPKKYVIQCVVFWEAQAG